MKCEHCGFPDPIGGVADFALQAYLGVANGNGEGATHYKLCQLCSSNRTEGPSLPADTGMLFALNVLRADVANKAISRPVAVKRGWFS